MFLQPFDINDKLSVAEIVAKDYRTAEVFRRYGIGYCCGGKWPLDMACEMNGVDAEALQKEIKLAVRNVQISNEIDFKEWDTKFLIDYIINVHHSYLRKSIPATQLLLHEFAEKHKEKFKFLEELEKQFDSLHKKLVDAMEKEENEIFPYIRQITNAHRDKDSYGAMYIRTLRKPVDEVFLKGHVLIAEIILAIRQLTSHYNSPENVCTSHKVVLARLKELDQDIMQHIYLEQSILFPKVLAIEKEILGSL
jgi:regulator of cell morphogenesis and NO signaling